MLEIKNLTKIYKGNKKAVDDLSLTIKAGDIFGFIGHNGAGKSTAIKSLVGILDFEEGEILIQGKSIKQYPMECKRLMAYIPDNPDLYEHLTGIQFLNLISDIFQIDKKHREEKIARYANAFEITNVLGDLISSYSHGMKQKLAIISALVHSPKLLVLDEPFVGLDPKASLQLKNTMKEVCSEGSAVFFSTHVLEVAEKLCNKVGIINQGKLVACGDTKELVKDKTLEDLFMEVVNHEK